MNTLNIFSYILILAVSGFVISKSVTIFISSSTKLANLLNISRYTISILIISIATSLPELVVALTSGFKQNSILSYGNALGANLSLITLIPAITILIGGRMLSTKNVVKTKDIHFSTFALFLALAFSIDGQVSRLDGIILVSIYAIYFFSLLKKGTLAHEIIEKFDTTNTWKQGVLFAISLVMLLGASQGVVFSAMKISELLQLNLGYVGLTIIALGTSLPEISYSLSLIKHKGRDHEILGNVIGSVVTNSTLVLGTAAIVYPINLRGGQIGFPTIIILIMTLLMFLIFAKSDQKISRKEALVLLGIYVLYVSLEYIVSI